MQNLFPALVLLYPWWRWQLVFMIVVVNDTIDSMYFLAHWLVSAVVHNEMHIIHIGSSARLPKEEERRKGENGKEGML